MFREFLNIFIRINLKEFEIWRPKTIKTVYTIDAMTRNIKTKLDLYLPTIIFIQWSLTWKRCQFVFNQNSVFEFSCWSVHFYSSLHPCLKVLTGFDDCWFWSCPWTCFECFFFLDSQLRIDDFPIIQEYHKSFSSGSNSTAASATQNVCKFSGTLMSTPNI